MKRILTTNISPSGLDTDAASKALLLHRNTPAQDMGVSPAELLFGRPLEITCQNQFESDENG